MSGRFPQADSVHELWDNLKKVNRVSLTSRANAGTGGELTEIQKKQCQGGVHF